MVERREEHGLAGTAGAEHENVEEKDVVDDLRRDKSIGPEQQAARFLKRRFQS
jgi:hypothetical protein